MEIEIKTALIGVGATIAGTILGWGLNCLSNLGKLNIYVSSWNDEFCKDDTGEIKTAKMKEEVGYYGYKGTLDIYNSSTQTKIMRNIRVCFCDDEKELKEITPYDDSTLTRSTPRVPAHYDAIGVLNIPPKSVITISIHRGLWENKEKNISLDFLWNSKKIYIKYINENGKTKSFKIKEVDFINFFTENKVEKI